MNTSRPGLAAFSLRRWLIAALLCIAVLPPLAVWVLHAASAVVTAPSAQTLAAARAYAIGNVSHWTDSRWQVGARAYFAAEQVDAELRPRQRALVRHRRPACHRARATWGQIPGDRLRQPSRPPGQRLGHPA